MLRLSIFALFASTSLASNALAIPVSSSPIALGIQQGEVILIRHGHGSGHRGWGHHKRGHLQWGRRGWHHHLWRAHPVWSAPQVLAAAPPAATVRPEFGPVWSAPHVLAAAAPPHATVAPETGMWSPPKQPNSMVPLASVEQSNGVIERGQEVQPLQETQSRVATAPIPEDPPVKDSLAINASKRKSMSCDAAARIVAGYAFSEVNSVSCAGSTYEFQAKRNDQSYSVMLSATDGKLINVTKQAGTPP
jgi:hypothetical protein